jgi:hypothetical protein
MAAKSKNIAGDRVREARLKHRPPLTQDELSGRLSALGVAIDRAGVSKIEVGLRCILDFEVKALAKTLGVTVDWLLGTRK